MINFQSSLTPDEMEYVALAAAGRPLSSGIGGFCREFVKDILLRVSLDETLAKTSHVEVPTSEIHMDTPGDAARPLSSGIGRFCHEFIKDVLLRVSLETPVQRPTGRSVHSSPEAVSEHLLRISIETPEKMEKDTNLPSYMVASISPDDQEASEPEARPISTELHDFCHEFIGNLLKKIADEEQINILSPDDTTEASGVEDDLVSNRALESACDKIVDELLLRISLEGKSPTEQHEIFSPVSDCITNDLVFGINMRNDTYKVTPIPFEDVQALSTVPSHSTSIRRTPSFSELESPLEVISTLFLRVTA